MSAIATEFVHGSVVEGRRGAEMAGAARCIAFAYAVVPLIGSEAICSRRS